MEVYWCWEMERMKYVLSCDGGSKSIDEERGRGRGRVKSYEMIKRDG